MALLLKWLLLLHPFYVSVTELNHNAKTEELEISIRIFTNDFESALRKNYPTAKIDLLNSNAAQHAADDALIKKYVASHFSIAIDGKNYPLQFVGREIIEENTWNYFEIKGVKSLKKLHIANKLLYEWQPQQSNMHVVKYSGQEKTFKLDNPETEVDFSF